MGAGNSYQLEYAPVVYDDLDDIFAYIGGELQDPDTAMNLILEIEAAILKIPEFPYQYPITRDAMLAHRGYRMLPIENFAVFYLVDDVRQTVRIQRVLYGKRNFKWLL